MLIRGQVEHTFRLIDKVIWAAVVRKTISKRTAIAQLINAQVHLETLIIPHLTEGINLLVIIQQAATANSRVLQ